MPKLTSDTFRVEKNLRSILGLIALVVLPPFLMLLALAKSPGMTDPTALDHAQLARQIAAGRGFTTDVLRPLTLALRPGGVPHQDLVNAPGQPLLLAGGFALAEPTEQVTAVLGVALWLLTVWLVFVIARYWWNVRAAGLATVFCACSMAGLMTATAGLPQPLLALVVFGAVAAVFPKPDNTKEGDSELPLWQPAVAGVLCGAAMLTDYRLLPLALVLGVYLAKTQERRGATVSLFVGCLLLVLLPWFIRNLLVSGRFFGLYWYEALENTRQFPGESIWRLTFVPAHPLLYLLVHPWDLARKLALGLMHYRSAGLGVLEPLALLLAAVALFGAPAKSSRRQLAWIAVSSVVLTILLSCITRPDVRLLLAWTPVLGCVAAAQLVAWAQANVGGFITANARLRLSTTGMRSLAYSAAVAVVAFPVVLQLGRSYAPSKPDMAAIAAAVNKRLPNNGAVLTDVPAAIAWYLNRPALLLNQREADLPELEKQAGLVAGIYLSPAIGEIPPREMGDWWMWVVSPRGVYHGLVVVPNSPLPGILRLPRGTKTGAIEPEWLDGLQKAIHDNPQFAEAHVKLAFGYFTLGRLREAEREFREAGRLDEYNVEALIGLWQTLAQLNQADGTLRLAQLVGQIPAQDPRAKPLLEQAVAHFEQVLSQQPGDPWLLLNLIVCRSRLGQWKAVEPCYARLAQVLPKAFPPRLLLTTLHLQEGEITKAAAECALLIQEHPDMPTAHDLAGRVWLAQDKLEDALKEFETTARLRPQWIAAHVQAGQVCQRLKRYDEAVKHLETALQLSPKQVNLQLNLADIYLAQEKTAAAISLYSGILATDAKQPVALNNLAELLTRTGKATEALSLARRAVSLYPQNPLIRDTAGWTAFQAGNKEEAILDLREALRIAPKQGISYYHLGKVLLALQQNEEARACLRRALDCDLPDQVKEEAQKVLGTA